MFAEILPKILAFRKQTTYGLCVPNFFDENFQNLIPAKPYLV